MNRQQLLAVVEEGWRQWDVAVAGLDEAAMCEARVVEAWSIKDLLGHVTAWEQVALRHVDHWRRSASLLGDGAFSTDGFNASEAAKRHTWSFTQVQDEAAETHQRLRATLQALADEDWSMLIPEGEGPITLGDWVGGALSGPSGLGAHTAEHVGHIRTWRDLHAGRRAGHIATLVAARCEILQAIDGLSDEELTHPGIGGGDWSVRETLAHIAAWDRQMVSCIEAWLDGIAPPASSPDVHSFNAQAAEQARVRSLAATLLTLSHAHEDLLAVMQRANGRSGTFRWPTGEQKDLTQVAVESAHHERQHLAELMAWREQLEHQNSV